MPVTPVSSTIFYPQDLCDGFRQGTEDFQRLARALDTGDLAGAQKAFEAFKQDIQNIQRAKNRQHITQTIPRQQNNGNEVTSSHDTGIGSIINVMA